MSIFVHELTDLKKEIKRGVPIKWGLQLFWSLFCLCAGEIVTASLTQEKFSLKQHICNANGFFQAMLVVSLSMSILLFFIGKFSGSAIDSIDQMLKQHGL